MVWSHTIDDSSMLFIIHCHEELEAIFKNFSSTSKIFLMPSNFVDSAKETKGWDIYENGIKQIEK